MITFADVFTGEIAKDTLIDLIIDGWTNPDSETLISVEFEVI